MNYREYLSLLCVVVAVTFFGCTKLTPISEETPSTKVVGDVVLRGMITFGDVLFRVSSNTYSSTVIKNRFVGFLSDGLNS